MFYVSTFAGFLSYTIDSDNVTTYSATHNIRYASWFKTFEAADVHAKNALSLICEKDEQWFAVLKTAQSTD